MTLHFSELCPGAGRETSERAAHSLQPGFANGGKGQGGSGATEHHGRGGVTSDWGYRKCHPQDIILTPSLGLTGARWLYFASLCVTHSAVSPPPSSHLCPVKEGRCGFADGWVGWGSAQPRPALCWCWWRFSIVTN